MSCFRAPLNAFGIPFGLSRWRRREKAYSSSQLIRPTTLGERNRLHALDMVLLYVYRSWNSSAPIVCVRNDSIMRFCSHGLMSLPLQQQPFRASTRATVARRVTPARGNITPFAREVLKLSP